MKRYVVNAVVGLSCAALIVTPTLAQSIVGGGANSPQVVTSANGTPLVIINTPNGQGVSHNTYSQFDVGQGGAVLNNADQNHQKTNVAGLIQGNANLKNGVASLIINEVTTNNPSQLNGFLEVGGAKANVVVANPYGLTCDGCGFINTDHVVLTTGTPRLKDGAFERLDVTQGTVTIGKRGANAKGVSQFDLIARKVNFAGSVHGQRVRVIAGKNDVLFATGEVRKKGGGGESSELAIDSTVFGGMYANKITIISTERGAGVRAPHTMSASAQGMQITADGRLVIGQAQSQGAASFKSRSKDIVVKKVITKAPLSLEARRDLILQADGVIVSEAAAEITVGRDLQLEDKATVRAGGDLTVKASRNVALAYQSGLISERDVNLSAYGFTGQDQSFVYAGVKTNGGVQHLANAQLDVTSDLALNAGATIRASADVALRAGGNLSLKGGAGIAAQGQLNVAVQDLNVEDQSYTYSKGSTSMTARGQVTVYDQSSLSAIGALSLVSEGGLSFRDGSKLTSHHDLTVAAQFISGAGQNSLYAGDFSQGQPAKDVSLNIEAKGDISFAQVGLYSGGQLALKGKTIAILKDASLPESRFASGTDLSITAEKFSFSYGKIQAGESAKFSVSNAARIHDAQISTMQLLSILGGGIELKSVKVSAKQDVSLVADSKSITSTDTELLAGRNLTLKGAQLDLQGYLGVQEGNIDLRTAGGLSVTGRVVAGGSLVVSGQDVVHQGGEIFAGKGVTISGANVTLKDMLKSTGEVTLASSGSLALLQGAQAQGAVLLSSDKAVTLSGAVTAGKLLQISANGNVTSDANLTAQSSIHISAQGDLTNRGALLTNGGLTLTAKNNLVNSGSGGNFTGASAQSLILKGDTIEHSGKLVVVQSLNIDAEKRLKNSGQLIAGGQVKIVSDVLQNLGVLRSNSGITVYARSLDHAGHINAQANVMLDISEDFKQTGQVLSAQNVQIKAMTFDVAGTIYAGQALSLNAQVGAVSNGATLTGLNSAELRTSLGDLTVSGKVQSAGNLKLTSNKNLMTSKTGVLLSSKGNVVLDARTAFQNAGHMTAGKELILRSNSAENLGQLTAAQRMTLTVSEQFSNQGQIQAAVFNATLNYFVNTGSLKASVLGKITAQDFENKGTLASIGLSNVDKSGQLIVQADKTFKNSGVLDAKTILSVKGGTFENLKAGLLEGGSVVALSAAQSFTNAGKVISEGKLEASFNTDLINSGLIQSNGALAIKSSGFKNSGHINAYKGAAFCEARQTFENVGGQLFSDTGVALRLKGGLTLDRLGGVTTQGYLDLAGVDNGYLDYFTVKAGEKFGASGDVLVKTKSAENKGTVYSGAGMLSLNVKDNIDNTGFFYAGGAGVQLLLGGTLDNNGGQILAAKALVIAGADFDGKNGARADKLLNLNGGTIETLAGDINIFADSVDNITGQAPTYTSEDLPQTKKTIGARSRSGWGDNTHNYKEVYTDRTIKTATINGTAAKIVSSGNITLNSNSFTNAFSHVKAGKSIQLQTGSFDNVSATDSYTDTTVVEHWLYEDRQWPQSNRDILQSREDPKVATTITKQHFGTIEAGGAITGNVGDLTNGVTSNATTVVSAQTKAPSVEAVSGPAQQSGVTQTLAGMVVSTVQGETSSPRDDISVLKVETTTVPIGVQVSTGGPALSDIRSDVSISGFTAPGADQVFSQDPNPEAKYLIETRHKFIDQTTFTSSDHFLDTLGFDPDATQKRLGDAFVETRAIRDQLFSLVGKTILDPDLSEKDQIKAMYDNAIDASTLLKLRPGIALSADQIEQLTTDIIWMEEQIVNGQKVLVPQVYLAKSGKQKGAQDGAQILASDISLTANGFKNTGTFSATNDLILNADQDIENLGGSIRSGGALQLASANGTLLNLSGEISGVDVTLSAQKIKSETFMVRSGAQDNYADQLGEIANITASGDLSIIAVDTAEFKGSALNSGGDLRILAGDDITFSALNKEAAVEFKSSDYEVESYSSDAIMSSVTSKGDISIISGEVDDEGRLSGGGDITFEGSDVVAGRQLDVTTLAGNVAFKGVKNVDYAREFTQSKGLFSSSSSLSETLDVAHKTSSVSAAEVNVTAGQNILDQSSSFDVSGASRDLTKGNSTGLTLRAGGHIISESLTDVSASKTVRESTKLFGLVGSKSEQSLLDLTALETRANVTGDMTVIAGGNLSLSGGDYTVSGDVNKDVQGTVILKGAVSTAYSEVKSERNNGITITNTTDVSLDQSAKFTGFNVGGDNDFEKVGTLTTEDGTVVPDTVVMLDQTQVQMGARSAGLMSNGKDITDGGGMSVVDQFLPDATGSPQSAQAENTDTAAKNNTNPYADSMVQVGLPTAQDGAEFTYLDKIKTVATIEDMQLIQHQFSDEQTTLNPAFKVLLTIAVNSVIPGSSAALSAFTSSLAVGVIEGGITGNMDLGDIFKNAGMSALTAGLGEGLTSQMVEGLGVSGLSNESLIGLKTGTFSTKSIATGLVSSSSKAAISAGIEGGSFKDHFKSNLKSYVSSEMMKAQHNAVGDQVQSESNPNGIWQVKPALAMWHCTRWWAALSPARKTPIAPRVQRLARPKRFMLGA